MRIESTGQYKFTLPLYKMAAVGGAGGAGGAAAAAAPNDLGPEVQPRDLVVSGTYYVRRFSEYKKVRVSRIRLAGPTPNDLFIMCIQTNGATPVYGVGPTRDPDTMTKFYVVYDVYSPQHELEMRVGFTKSTGTSGARGTGPANIINSFLSSKKSTPRRRKRSRKTRTAKRRQ